MAIPNGVGIPTEQRPCSARTSKQSLGGPEHRKVGWVLWLRSRSACLLSSFSWPYHTWVTSPSLCLELSPRGCILGKSGNKQSNTQPWGRTIQQYPPPDSSPSLSQLSPGVSVNPDVTTTLIIWCQQQTRQEVDRQPDLRRKPHFPSWAKTRKKQDILYFQVDVASNPWNQMELTEWDMRYPSFPFIWEILYF